MKVYLITQAQMDQLNERFELSAMRASNVLSQHDQKTFENEDLFRAFNFVVRKWQEEVGK